MTIFYGMLQQMGHVGNQFLLDNRVALWKKLVRLRELGWSSDWELDDFAHIVKNDHKEARLVEFPIRPALPRDRVVGPCLPITQQESRVKESAASILSIPVFHGIMFVTQDVKVI